MHNQKGKTLWSVLGMRILDRKLSVLRCSHYLPLLVCRKGPSLHLPDFLSEIKKNKKKKQEEITAHDN